MVEESSGWEASNNLLPDQHLSVFATRQCSYPWRPVRFVFGTYESLSFQRLTYLVEIELAISRPPISDVKDSENLSNLARQRICGSALAEAHISKPADEQVNFTIKPASPLFKQFLQVGAIFLSHTTS